MEFVRHCLTNSERIYYVWLRADKYASAISRRQYPLTVNNVHYHVDLVFYHRILKYFVLIDLKKNSVQHIDIDQMNMYMGYFAKEENMADDNPPIGIILSHNKDELLVEYATYGMDSNLFVSKYELYLPNRSELQKLVNNILEQDTKKEEKEAE